MDIFKILAADTGDVGDPGTYTNVGGATLDTQIKTIINWVVGVLGIAAVIVIIIGGVFYMTSNGDAAKVKKGKDTILYGVIGLIIAVLAFAIVNFAIGSLS